MSFANTMKVTRMNVPTEHATVRTAAGDMNPQARPVDTRAQRIACGLSVVTLVFLTLFSTRPCDADGEIPEECDRVPATSVESSADATHGKSDASPSEVGKPDVAVTCGGTPAQGVKERNLFDGASLTGWTKTKFGGEGTVTAKDGILGLGFGAFMTGVTYADKTPLPTSNYEVVLEARRAEGTDFFCGLTVPYKESHFSLIVGGWGGGVTGISSIDGLDASENDTTTYIPYKKGKWYCIRLRVTDDRIKAWIDKEVAIDFAVDEQKFSTRLEVDLSKPLGICSFDTRAELRNIRLRSWDPAARGSSIDASPDEE